MATTDYMAGLTAQFEATEAQRIAIVIDMPRAFADVEGAVIRRLIEQGLDESADRPVTTMLGQVRSTVVPAVTKVVERMHTAGGHVITVRFGSPDLTPDLMAPTVRSLAQVVREAGDASQYASIIDREPSDLVIDRLASSAFTGTALDALLRRLGVDTVVVCGVPTDGTVSSTARDAADLDYRSVILADGCAALDPARHDASLRNHARLFGPVVQSDEVVDAIIDSGRR